MMVFRIAYHRDGGSWWAESEDLPGFTAVADSFGELQQLVIEGVPFYAGTSEVAMSETWNGVPMKLEARSFRPWAVPPVSVVKDADVGVGALPPARSAREQMSFV